MGHVVYVQNADWLISEQNCPGFCGRVLNETVANGSDDFSVFVSTLSECQACPWGSKSGKNSICEQCTTLLKPYDYCFLIFNALVPLFVNGLFVKLCSLRQYSSASIKRQQLWTFIHSICVSFESSLALIFSLLLFEPRGTLHTVGCIKRDGLQDWYPIFYNPVVNYTKTLRCSNELVYPLYSLPFLYFAFSFLNLIVIRSALYILARYKFGVKLPPSPFYAAFWILPIAACGHTFLFGIFYYIYPHICIITSLTLNAIHLAIEGRRSINEILRLIFSFQNAEHLILIFIHMTLFGFGIISILLGGLSISISNFNLFLLTSFCFFLPLPTCFYILTIRLTTPTTTRYRR